MPTKGTDAPSLPWDYIAKLVVIGDSATGKSSLTTRLCEGRFSNTHDVTIGVEFGSRIVPVGPPGNAELNISNPGRPRISDSKAEPNISNSGRPRISDSKAELNVSNSGRPRIPETKADGQQKKMKLSLWDTAGQETYKSITRSYFRGASGALLVFDITRRSSFEAVTNWLNDLRQIAEEGIVVILVGNKLDLADHSTNMEGGNKRAVTRQEAEDWCEREGITQYIETSAKSGEGVERAFLEVAERIYMNIEAGKYDLNDRRSGVKGYGTGTGREAGQAPKSVNLTMGDVHSGKGALNSCC